MERETVGGALTCTGGRVFEWGHLGPSSHAEYCLQHLVDDSWIYKAINTGPAVEQD